MLLKALPLALVIFVLFPRFHVPAWLALQNQHRAQSGLGEVLEPGEVSQLVLSNELVFRAKFLADRPATTGLYWRGPVYSLTNGRQWRIIDNDISIKYQDIIAHDRQAYHYSLLLQGNMHGWVYALDMPMEYDPSLWRNGNYQLMGRNNNNPAEYRITSYPHYNTGYITKTEYRQNLQLPSAVPPRITDLVNRLRQGSTQPTEYIDKVLAFFQQQGFSYTLQPPLMGKQPIERFLFDEKRGFCSHYATAFVYLMRAAAIPARVVAGYQGGKFNPVGQFVEVRQSDAHVWAEVWLADKGWLRVDPTLSVAPRGAGQQGPSADNAAAAKPLAVSGEATEPPLVQWTKLLWNDLDYHWQKSVLSFGENNQSHIFQRLGLHYTKTAGLLAVILAATLAVLVAIFATPSPLTAVLPELRQYRKFCRKMAKLGLARQSGEGAMAFAARTATSHPELAAKVNEISQLFIKLHYQRCADGGDLQQLKKLVRSFSGKP